MSYFKTKMHQIRFRLPQNPLGSLQRSPDSLAGFKGPTSKGGGEKGKEGRPVFSVQFVGNPRVWTLSSFFAWMGQNQLQY